MLICVMLAPPSHLLPQGKPVQTVRQAAQGDLPQSCQFFDRRKVFIAFFGSPGDATGIFPLSHPLQERLRLHIDQLYLIGLIEHMIGDARTRPP